MAPVKVCHMTSAHPPEDVRIFHKECVSLAQAGYEVYLVERGESYEKNGVRVIGVGEMPGKRLKRMTEGARRVYEAALSLDCELYHLHDPELLPFGLKLKKRGKKVIFDIHENTSDSIMEKRYIPQGARALLSGSYRAFEASVCKRLDALITVTPTQTEYFRRLHAETVEVSNFPVWCDAYRQPSFQRKALVFAGGIAPQWDHERIICALEKLPDAEYVLCGGENRYLESLKALPGWEKVEYRGRIPHEKVSETMAECMVGAALLLPGRNTAGEIGTMGNTKIFEEMIAGLPVVCTDFALWRAFVEKYECGICVDPTDEQAILSAFSYLLENPEEARRMGENGRRAIREEFNWKSQAERLVQLYGRMTRRR